MNRLANSGLTTPPWGGREKCLAQQLMVYVVKQAFDVENSIANIAHA